MRHDGVWVSTALTLTPQRDSTPDNKTHYSNQTPRARREEVWQVAGVHGADITGAAVLRAGEKPQDFNDPRWALRRQAR